ncbi:hypothetical protein K2X85_10695 [bacterium]|jgi:hypothetical protein|nr:hypothetical protein [bacterium]
MRDQRGESRYAIDSPCRVRFKENNHLVEVAGEVIDVSSRGGKVLIPHCIAIGTIVVVEMEIVPNHRLFSQVIECDAHQGAWSVGYRVVENILPFSIFRKLISQGRVIFDERKKEPEKPAPTSETPKVETPACFHMLDLSLPATERDIHLAFRRKAMKAHPDHGGDPADFIALHQAMEEAIQFVAVTSSE